MSLLLWLCFIATFFRNSLYLHAEVDSKNPLDCRPLNPYILCYETPVLIIKRDHEVFEEAFINFRAFHHDFDVIVFPRKHTILKSSVKINSISSSGKTTKFGMKTHMIEVFGKVRNEKSDVTGLLFKDAFHGVIHTETVSYYLEPMHKYQKNSTFNVVIYRDSDIYYWEKNQKETGGHFHPWKSKEIPKRSFSFNENNFTDLQYAYGHGHIPTNIYLNRARTVSGLNQDSKICHMHAVADHTFFQYQGLHSTENTLSEIVYYITQADAIFRRTDFNGDNLGDNIGFALDEVTIYDDISTPNYLFASEVMNVDTYLDKFSSYDFNSYCLAVVFTHRDFAGGVIGLAWMGSSSTWGSIGGLCQERVYYHDPPFYDMGYYSFNTLLVSTLNFGGTLPQKVTALTLTHEIGHSFGSPHDPDLDSTCSPGGAYGNYIMHAYASDANKPNNWDFSSCSKSYINPVVINKGGCMETMRADEPACGNRIIDEGEDCDCGFAALCEVEDYCCEPPSLMDDTGCTYSAAKSHYCSPMSSPCCNEDCQIISDSEAVICKLETECTESAICDGVSSECPELVVRHDGTPCDAGRGICHNGLCTRDLCLLKELSQCQCTGSSETQCQLCCMCSDATCVPAYYLGLRALDASILYKDPGQSCNDYQGYCNQQLECITVDAEAAIERLNAMFSKNTAQLAFEWLQNYWYLIVIVIAVVVLLILIFRAHKKANKSEPTNTLALQSGKMALVWQQANHELHLIKEDIKQLDKKFSTSMEREHKHKPVDFLVAVGRMCVFFPTAPRRIIINTVRTSSNEEFAVKLLLVRGYPMIKLLPTKY